MAMVFRCFVEKKEQAAVEADAYFKNFTGFLNVSTLRSLRYFIRYDAEGLSEVQWTQIQAGLLYDPVAEICYQEDLPDLPGDMMLLCWESLPGQYDQQADCCAQAIAMATGEERPLVKVARVLALQGISSAEFKKIASHVINPVESAPSELGKPDTLRQTYPEPAPVMVEEGFCQLDADGLKALHARYNLAMDDADLQLLQDYFRREHRDPTETELRMVDTYWSDHCRHTTFSTHLTDVRFEDPRAAAAWDAYQETRRGLYGLMADVRPVTLMDVATCGMKVMRKQGKLTNLDESEEINACTVKVKAVVDNAEEDWLLFFKNETHNHPTEIEPFGGAATCVGGAIRDPMSGRAHVYQAMRVTGSGDPRVPLEQTLPGKLPTRTITLTAANGNSSYGNQIGLASSFSREVFHPGYVAKRMELGAVLGAAPAASVVREQPAPGDLVLLVGGRTGRDGIGGATGSSKSQNVQSAQECSAEVQKGDAPEEHKIQRLFRNPACTTLIKRCNDFGAGGVSVAIGELADGIQINLDAVPLKYPGLNGTEIAISESQERMAVVIAPESLSQFLKLARNENLETTVVAQVTRIPRLVMTWQGRQIVNLSREFLSTNGAPKKMEVVVAAPHKRTVTSGTASWAERLLALVSDLNFCSQRGIAEYFDGTVGAGSVLNFYGGRTGLSPSPIIAALLPVLRGECETCSVMSVGFNPMETERDPFVGGRNAIIRSLGALIAAGASLSDSYLTLQEYFPRLGDDKTRWGLPLAALLGAFEAQLNLGVAAIGGKDSMSGTFQDLDVPSTLVSFGVASMPAAKLIPPHFPQADQYVYLLEAAQKTTDTPDYAALLDQWDAYRSLLDNNLVSGARAVERGGPIGAIFLACLGESLGFDTALPEDFSWFRAPAGSIVFASKEELPHFTLLGRLTSDGQFTAGNNRCPLASLQAAWEAPLASVFPTAVSKPAQTVPVVRQPVRSTTKPAQSAALPRVLVPVCPGVNNEEDVARALRRAGARPELIVVRNKTPKDYTDSIDALVQALAHSQMLILPGGFTGGDEKGGAGRYWISLLRYPAMREAVQALLDKQDGLILGLGGAFNALVKMGWLPGGTLTADATPALSLTANDIGRHQAGYVHTRVASTLSPWLTRCQVDEVYTLPLSAGEGRLLATDAQLEALSQSGQIAFQYCTAEGAVLSDTSCNPCGSAWNVEGLTSPDGRILGRMAHPERRGALVGRNVPGRLHQPVFESGVDYFR